MKTPNTRHAIPTLWLERYALGECTEDQRRRIDDALQSDPDLAARLQTLRDDNAAHLSQYPAEETAAAIQHRLRAARAAQQQRASRAPLWIGLGVSAAAAAAAVALLWSGGDQGVAARLAPQEPESILLKGAEAPALAVDRQTRNGSEPLLDGAQASPGDVLMLRYAPQEARYGVIVSIDGRGNTTLHLPASPQADTRLHAQGPALVPLPHAFALDDAPRFERFFLVTSDAPLDASDVLRAAQRLGPERAEHAKLALPAGATQTSLLIRKELAP